MSTVDDPRKIIDNKIRAIINLCKSIENKKIVELKEYQSLRNHYEIRKRPCCDIYLFLAIVFGILAIATTSLSLFGTKNLYYSAYLKLFDIDLDYEQCLVPKLEVTVDLFRPPNTCDLCRDFHQIDRVAKISREEFEKKYVDKNRPVIVTDGMTGWLASEKFDYDFFRQIYRANSSALNAVDDHCQFFSYKNSDEFESLEDVFEMDDDRAHMKGENFRPWYVGWSNCDYSTAYLLRQFYSRPYFLPDRSESSRLDWIFMGTPGLGAHMHVDNVDLPSWQAQVRGYYILNDNTFYP